MRKEKLKEILEKYKQRILRIVIHKEYFPRGLEEIFDDIFDEMYKEILEGE